MYKYKMEFHVADIHEEYYFTSIVEAIEKEDMFAETYHDQYLHIRLSFWSDTYNEYMPIALVTYIHGKQVDHLSF